MAILCILGILLLGSPPAGEPPLDFTPVRELTATAVADSTFPAASIAIIYRGQTVFHEAFGKLTYDAHSPAATTSTIFDLASLTKPIVTAAILQQLTERDSLNLNEHVSSYLPAFAQNGKEQITIKNLLLHNSGLRGHQYYIETCSTPGEVIETICRDTLIAPRGKETRYSDLGFMILGKVLETITGNSLAENFRARFSEPLGMASTMFTPPGDLHYRIAPTEQDTLWNLDIPRPLVHDHNTALLGGIAGQAGLFSTTGDLARFVTMYMQGGTLEGIEYLKSSTTRKFSRRYSDDRALGWDMRSKDGKSSSGDYFSKKSYGHLGFTGTSIWIDPKKDLAIIVLTNRVYPTAENRKIREFRPRLHNTVIRCLGLNDD